MRDYEGYAETRRLILVSKPTININWLAYAVSEYLVSAIILSKYQ